jgi:hypothetical protein
VTLRGISERENDQEPHTLEGNGHDVEERRKNEMGGSEAYTIAGISTARLAWSCNLDYLASPQTIIPRHWIR